MLPDDQLHLLTAAMDGEFTPADERCVRHLLAVSAEARELFARLQADRGRLRNLPPAAPPTDLHTRIMARLPKTVPTAPTPVTTLAPNPVPFRRRASLSPLAVAASLLLALAGSSFWYFTRGDQTNPGDGTLTARTDRAAEDVLPRDNAALPSVPRAVEPRAVPNTLAQIPLPPMGPDKPDTIPAPRPLVKDVNAFPPLPPVTFDHVRVRVPFLTAVADLDRDDVRQRLADELSREPAVRIDLFVTDAARGAALFQAACKTDGVAMMADALTQERIKRKQATAYAVYAESLTPAELRDLLVRLSAADGKTSQRLFDTLHLTAVQPADQRELKDLLGTDPGLGKRPAVGDKTEPKPISAGTGDQLTKSLTGSAPKPGGKRAFLTTFTPAAFRTHPSMSKELKEYLARRGERSVSAVPVLIVIRQPAGG